MLRKPTWLALLEEIPELGELIKNNIKVKYIREIYIKMMQEKKKYLYKLQ